MHSKNNGRNVEVAFQSFPKNNGFKSHENVCLRKVGKWSVQDRSGCAIS